MIENHETEELEKKDDMTGRDRIMKNTLWSWAGHMVFVVAGFVMPRMIDHHVGQVSLGIWDFSWSLVSYFSIAGLGVGSSVNRYVAKLRASEDIETLIVAVSSVACVQAIIAIVLAVVTFALVSFLPVFFKAKLGAELPEASWVVAFLGASIVVQMAFDTNRGIITGCHRWDLHNAINSVSYGVAVVAMVLCLSLGGDLRTISVVYFCVGLFTELYRFRAARNLFPEIRVEWKRGSWEQARKMIAYGIKTIVAGLSPLVLIQGTSLLIVGHLGPAALAVFSRPNGLIRNATVFVSKYAMILTPTAGSLQGAGKHDEIRALFYRTTRNSVAMSLPIVLFLAIQGEHLLQIWMGPRYSGGHLIAIMSAGAFLPMSLQPAITILAGINAHGTIGWLTLLLTIFSMATGVGLMSLTGWTLHGSAVLLSVTFTLVNGIVLLAYVCRKLDVPLGNFLRKSFAVPLLTCVPYALFLYAARYLLDDRPVLSVLSGCIGAVAILGPIYWILVLGPEIREKIRRKASGLWVAKPVGTD